MVLTLTIPEPGNDKRIKDVIIDILIFEWPLSLSQLYRKVSKNYSCSRTCQATYKALCELTKEGVLLKQGKAYSINLNWIAKLKEFSMHIENNYKSEDKVPLIEGVLKTKTENNVTILTFNSLVEMDKAWINIKKEYYKKTDKKDDVTFWEGNHCWWLLVYPELEYSEMEIVKQKKVRDFVLCHNDTPLDRTSKKFYYKSGVGFKTLKKPIEGDMTVFGDTIMQVYLPKDLKIKIDEVYRKYKTPGEVDVHAFLKEVLTKKAQVNLVLTKNKEIAEQLKQKVLKEFNQKV
jgi:hypothetical protein